MYKVKKVVMVSLNGERVERYHLLKADVPMFNVNQFLDHAGRNSLNTGKQYAYRLKKYLTFIDSRGKMYKDASVRDIVKFVDSLLFDTGTALYIGNGRVTYNTVSHYLTVIKEFYKYLDDEKSIEVNVIKQTRERLNENSYLYGQIWGIENAYILNKRITRVKGTRDYEKWYSEEEKEMILSNFTTLRDKAIFLLTLEGLRIDEALSLREIDYDAISQEVKLYKSKGKVTGNVGAIVVLSKPTGKVLDDYIYNERDVAISLLQKQGTFAYSKFLFLNLRKGEHLGKTVSYNNFFRSLKRSAEKAGMDPSRIRTHSGRSTKTMELLHHQVLYPEDNITDEHIRQLMRWSSSDSIAPYVNTHDKRLSIESAKKIYERQKGVMENEEQ